jgi:creatinine amidohydrolase
LVSHAICYAVAQKVDGMLVLPPVNVGVSYHYDDFPFTLTLRPEVLVEVLKDISIRLFVRVSIELFIIMVMMEILPIEIAARSVKY